MCRYIVEYFLDILGKWENKYNENLNVTYCEYIHKEALNSVLTRK